VINIEIEDIDVIVAYKTDLTERVYFWILYSLTSF